MLGHTPRFERLIARTEPLKAWIDHHTERILVGALIVLTGLLLAFLAAQLREGEKIRIGNTSGTLSALISVNEQRIMVGAGPSRSHAADFLGRSTRPWDREIDVLLLPGWDDRHTVGALGLIERRAVRSIAVIGLPGDEPSWTLLEREAERADVPLRIIERPHRLELSENARFILSSSTDDEPGAWIRFEHQGKRIDLIDAAHPARFNPDPSAFSPGNDHIVVNMRTSSQPGIAEPTLLVIPQPHWQWDVSNINSPFWVGIERNDRLTLQMTDDSMRLPLDRIETGNSTE